MFIFVGYLRILLSIKKTHRDANLNGESRILATLVRCSLFFCQACMCFDLFNFFGFFSTLSTFPGYAFRLQTKSLKNGAMNDKSQRATHCEL